MNQFTLTDRNIKNFWKYVNKGKPGECWNWTGIINWLGYGRMGINYKSTNAHRISWTIHHGTIPPGMNVLHTCNNRRCVNPAHLYLGTQKENTKQAYRDGNLKPMQGEGHPRAKLTEAQVKSIRAEAKSLSHRALAKKYGMAVTSIQHIIERKTWRHI